LVAVTALAYQAWLVARRPPRRLTRSTLWILWTSIATTTIVLATWSALLLRYR
jgi:hypothetical protein